MLNNLIDNPKLLFKIKKILFNYGIPFSNFSALALIILLTTGGRVIDNENKNFGKTNIPIKSTNITQNEPQKKISTTQITNDAKIGIILEKYNLTKEQFDVVVAIVLAESKAESYDDAYGVINTIFNRTNSEKWTSWVSSIFGNELGKNLYYQAICPNQFVVYANGTYLDYINANNLPGYQAVIDFLYTKEIKHIYLSFVANGCDESDKEQLVENGNLYYNELDEADAIDKQKVKVIS